jgi:hypothetical protein
MSGSRALACVVLALPLFAAEAAPLWANAPPPFPRPDPIPSPLPNPVPSPLPNPTPDPAPKEMYPDDPIPRPKPRRPGLFRSCGSGTPAALAGVGAAWTMLWLGSRFTGRVRGSKRERS